MRLSTLQRWLLTELAKRGATLDRVNGVIYCYWLNVYEPSKVDSRTVHSLQRAGLIGPNLRLTEAGRERGKETTDKRAIQPMEKTTMLSFSRKLLPSRMKLLRLLDAEYQILVTLHNRAAPRNGAIPVGGGDWMDSFFRMEALRGTIGELRRGATLRAAVARGRQMSEVAVKLWNDKREWQVHRSPQISHAWIADQVYIACRKTHFEPGPL